MLPRGLHPLAILLTLAAACGTMMRSAMGASISQTTTNPPANSSVSVTLATSATVNQVLQLQLTDGVAATTGGTGCVNVSTTSSMTAAGAAGTSNLGTYDVLFTSGGPTGAQGCPTPTAASAIQTFSMRTVTPRAARLDASIVAGSTWSAVKFAQNDNNDWTSDTTGTTLTTTAATVIASIATGKVTQNVQLAWVINIGASSGAKSGTATLTLVAP